LKVHELPEHLAQGSPLYLIKKELKDDRALSESEVKQLVSN